MITKIVEVTQIIKVTYNESKFNDEFMCSFREYMYDFDDVDEHIKHLAQLHARGLADSNSFVEGYGVMQDEGISFFIDEGTEEILDRHDND